MNQVEFLHTASWHTKQIKEINLQEKSKLKSKQSLLSKNKDACPITHTQKLENQKRSQSALLHSMKLLQK